MPYAAPSKFSAAWPKEISMCRGSSGSIASSRKSAQEISGSGLLKILRRKTEVEHFPFAVAVQRQHDVGLARLQRIYGALHQQGPFC